MTSKPAVYVCDIDGTIANCDHRKHHVESTPKDWDSFYSKCDKDTPLADTLETVILLQESGYSIHFVTGRREQERDKTITWLDNHGFDMSGATGTKLIMRPNGNWRPDTELKQKVYDKYYSENADYDLIAVFEDRKSVVDMWRNNGVTVFHVDYGDF